MSFLVKLFFIAISLSIFHFAWADEIKFYPEGVTTTNHVDGYRSPGDKLLHKETFRIPAKVLMKNERKITFPPEGQPQTYSVTAVGVVDMSKKKGNLEVVRGMDSRFVDIYLTSQRGESFQGILQIFGKPFKLPKPKM